MIAAVRTEFLRYKALAEGAIGQMSDADLTTAPGDDGNSVAVICQHVAGNLVSRFTDFLSTDGEKPWRDRDDEFIDAFRSRDEVLAAWETGWSTLFDAIGSLRPEHMFWSVYIRGEPHTVPEALARSLSHTSYHVGQIVLIARVLNKSNWAILTIPRGGTKEHNQRMGYDPNPAAPDPDESDDFQQ